MKIARNMLSQHECDEILVDQHHVQLFRREWSPFHDSLTEPMFSWDEFSKWCDTPQGRFAQVYAQKHR